MYSVFSEMIGYTGTNTDAEIVIVSACCVCAVVLTQYIFNLVTRIFTLFKR